MIVLKNVVCNWLINRREEPNIQLDPLFSTKSLILSMNESRWLPTRTYWLIGGAVVLLLIMTLGYYTPHFSRGVRWLLALGFVGFTLLHFIAGYRLFRENQSFPTAWFLVLTTAFSTIRWWYAYGLLQHYLPETTVFYQPTKALWFIIPSSAVMVFLGYGIAQYRYWQRVSQERSRDTESAASQQLQFRSEGKEIQLPIEELLYVQANGEYMLYHSTDRRYPRFQRMKEAEAELEPLGFVRIHRSYLVVRSAVRAIAPTEVELVDGTVLPVSRTYRERL